MKTKIVSSTKDNISKSARLIQKGELVVFPTETVYGLGANALDKQAVNKIFKAKGRPSDNPLIVHIANKKDIFEYGQNIPYIVNLLTKKFWPGPLALVVKKSKQIPNIVTANLQTVAIRMPKNKTALDLIKKSGVPIAAPSANTFGKPSPTKAKHVFADLNGKVQTIIDGKNCKIGIESTVLDVTPKIPMILRPGQITKKDIEQVIGKISMHPAIKNINQKVSISKSPGLKYRHYSPSGKVFLFKNTSQIANILNAQSTLKDKVAILDFTKNKRLYPKFFFIALGNSAETFSKKIFDALRICDEKSIDIIFIKSLPKEGLGEAIMNRLERAAKR